MTSRLIEKNIDGIRLQGFSLAGEETVLVLPEMNVAFDIGRAPREAVHVDYVCLSHGHMDHSAGIAYYFSQRNFQGAPSGCMLVHHRLVPVLEELMEIWGRIEGHVSPYKFVGVDDEEDFNVHDHLAIRPFRVRHAGPTLGFALVDRRKKLKPQYASYSGQQIAALKKQGETVEYLMEIPMVTYCADTAVGDFLDRDYVRNAQVLIMECTFVDPDHLERARKGQHIHIDDLPEVMERVNSPNVVISHLTRRTGLRQAKAILQKKLRPEDWERVTILMDRFDGKRRQDKTYPARRAGRNKTANH